MDGQFPDLEQSVRSVTAAELKDRLDGGERVTLLDTRRPADFAAWHVDHPNCEAVNVPFTAFLEDDRPAEAVPEGVPEGHVVTCCAKGISSEYVAEFLAREGRSVEALADGMRGWARLYEAIDVSTAPLIRQYCRPSSGCLAYLVADGEEAAVIDPLRAFTERYLEDCAALGVTLRYAIDTHVHADHVSGVRSLRDRTGCDVVLPAGATERGLTFEATLLEPAETLTVGATTLEAVALPGHTTEMTGLRVGESVCVGDSVLCSGVARPDLEDPERAREGAATLFDTLRTIESWPDETTVLPGHTEAVGGDTVVSSTVGDLVDSLEAFSLSRERFVDLVSADLPPRPNDYETIIETNLGRGQVTDETAFELELGPNNCAAG